jgi:hypothetical protein
MRRFALLRGTSFFCEVRYAKYASRDTNIEPYFAQYDIYITQYGSIKIERLCKTNPISEKPKMIIILAITETCNNEQRTANYSKQTQSNPILLHVERGGGVN